jgi:L-aspartate oxidase
VSIRTTVLGAGAAGLWCSLHAADRGAVTVVAPGAAELSATAWAQGGIAAVTLADDTPERHAADTLAAGAGLCDPAAVDVLVQEAPQAVAELRAMGMRFDEEDGPALEGGHSLRRVHHAGGDRSGRALHRFLEETVERHPGIVRVDARAVAIETREGAASGVRIEGGAVVTSDRVVLATGGACGIFGRRTGPDTSVGEGFALAWHAGAALADLEFVQFHPTALSGSGVLLSEALRGAGALLLDDTGARFTDELAPRDVVAREIGARGTALLDLRPVDRDRFPSVIGSLEDAGFDPAVEPIPVAPAAHYTMGGVVTGLDGRTDLPSLYAAGECACTGVHGANRLASNSLLECLVFGRRAALASLTEPGLPARLDAPPDPPRSEAVTPAIRRALWQDAGLVRDAAGLERLRHAPHLLTRLIAESALARTESRGAHFRADRPNEDPELAGHVVHRPGQEAVLERWS